MKDYITAKWAVKQLQGRGLEKPFFMAVGFKTSSTWYVPQKYFDMYPLDKLFYPKQSLMIWMIF